MQEVQIREGGPTPLSEWAKGSILKGIYIGWDTGVSADLDPLEYESPSPYPLADLERLRILSHCILSIVSKRFKF